ncbi:integral membrane protein, C.elegans Sra family [Ancylostoma ceylanicum]|uniref:Integral membrane protein, C.elegans Sra family n=1 Tax=Ancylostoma ceylanicum TaxID=53326 RepID=A0A0D6LVY6_9BILA|nr:integral membrane protein, C.elegans Sra family [Ancylostoma ceylanicum]
MECEEVRELTRSTGFRLAIGIQAVTAFLSVIASAVALRKSKQLHFHINCKILMMSMLFLYIVHSIFLAVIQSIQLVLYITSDDPCKILFTVATCFCFRLPTTACLLSFVALQFAITVERMVALWKRCKYEEYGSRLGISLSAASVLISLVATGWAASSEEFKDSVPYCAAATARTADRVTLLCFYMCIITLLTLIAIVALFAFNKIAAKRKIFDLQSSYQIRENATIIPIYTLISPVLILFIIKWSQQLRAAKLKQLMNRCANEKDAYFRTYTQMWNNHIRTL